MLTSTRRSYNGPSRSCTGLALLLAAWVLMIQTGPSQATAAPKDPKFRNPAVFKCDDGPYGLALGNVNPLQDLELDLVVGCYSSSSVVVYINQGDWEGDPPINGFVPFDPHDPNNPPARRYSLGLYGGQVREVALAHVNNDAFLDIVVPLWGPEDTTRLAVFYNQANGQFAEPPAIYQPAPGHEMRPVRGMVVADLDKNGRIDVALAERRSGPLWYYDRIYVVWGSTEPPNDYWFEPEPTVVEITDNGQHYVSEVYDLTLGYFDDNPPTGTLDFATCNYGTEYISCVLNNGDRTFTPMPAINSPWYKRDITANYFNSDGFADLACPNSEVFVADEVRVWWGNGAGEFDLEEEAYPVVLDARAIDSGQICFDKYPDIVCVNRKEGYPDGSISVLVNNKGDGTFTEQYEFLVEPQGNEPKPVQVLIGDVTGDGQNDVITSNWHTGNVSVLVNKYLVTAPPGGP